MCYTKLFEYFKARRKSTKVFFQKRIQNLSHIKDIKPNFFTSTTLGRDSLIKTILEKCNPFVINKLLEKYKDTYNPQTLLDELEKSIMTSEKEAQDIVNYFKSHYGEDTFNLLKHLLIIKHKNARKLTVLGKEPFISFGNNVILLTRSSDQALVYNHFLNSFPDPLGLRLALSPQYHFAYENADFDEFIAKVRWHYTDFIQDKCQINRKDFLQDAPNVYDLKYRVAIKYCIDMFKSGIYVPLFKSLRIPQTGRLAYGNFCYDKVKEVMKQFETKDIINCIQYGILPDPWRFFDDVVKFVVDTKPVVGIKYKFISDPVSLIRKFKLRKVWNAKK